MFVTSQQLMVELLSSHGLSCFPMDTYNWGCDVINFSIALYRFMWCMLLVLNGHTHIAHNAIHL